jgi:hypothetical protein
MYGISIARQMAALMSWLLGYGTPIQRRYGIETRGPGFHHCKSKGTIRRQVAARRAAQS